MNGEAFEGSIVADAAVTEDLAFFHRSGYVRRQNAKRLAKEGRNCVPSRSPECGKWSVDICQMGKGDS